MESGFILIQNKMENIILDKEFCKIYFNSDKKYITVKWFGFPRSSDFRETCNLVIELMKKYKTGKLFTDNRNAKVFSVDDQKWLNTEWLPNAINAGYNCSATLINDDIFIKTAIQNIINHRNTTKVKSKLFTNENEAIEWLQSV